MSKISEGTIGSAEVRVKIWFWKGHSEWPPCALKQRYVETGILNNKIPGMSQLDRGNPGATRKENSRHHNSVAVETSFTLLQDTVPSTWFGGSHFKVMMLLWMSKLIECQVKNKTIGSAELRHPEFKPLTSLLNDLWSVVHDCRSHQSPIFWATLTARENCWLYSIDQ